MMQAGAQVVGLVEGAPKIGGYGVHAAKLAGQGFLSMWGTQWHVSTVRKKWKGQRLLLDEHWE
ncbi:MAG: hypothetical protein ACLSEX_00310 [Blautia sp.]